jgi:glycine/D-amino acid oxidase-like deaminating enzyme
MPLSPTSFSNNRHRHRALDACSFAARLAHSGILYVDNSDLGNAFDEFECQKERGLAVECADDFNGFCALWLPDEGQVENRKLTLALSRAAERAGVSFYRGETRFTTSLCTAATKS